MQHHISCAIIGTEQQLQQLGISGGKGVPGRADDEINELLDHGALSPARGAPTLCRGGASPRSSTTPRASRLVLLSELRPSPARWRPPGPEECSAEPPRICRGARPSASPDPAARGDPGGGRRWLGGGRGGASEREQWPRASGMIRTLMKRR